MQHVIAVKLKSTLLTNHDNQGLTDADFIQNIHIIDKCIHFF